MDARGRIEEQRRDPQALSLLPPSVPKFEPDMHHGTGVVPYLNCHMAL